MRKDKRGHQKVLTSTCVEGINACVYIIPHSCRCLPILTIVAILLLRHLLIKFSDIFLHAGCCSMCEFQVKHESRNACSNIIFLKYVPNI